MPIVTERLWQDYPSFAGRDLAEHDVVYLFVDGIAERLRLGQPREAVLAAWGITSQGTKVLLRLLARTKEDTVSCTEYLRDLKARRIRDPVLVATDGAPGLIAAVEEVFPRSLRQRCLADRIRNREAKVPAELWPEVKGQARAAYRASSPALARLTRDEFVKRLETGDALLPRRLRILHRALALTDRASSRDPDHEPAGAVVWRRASTHESHPARIRRTGGSKTQLRIADSCQSDLATVRNQ